jgi:hypothetical protein
MGLKQNKSAKLKQKKKITQKTRKLLAKGYEDHAEEDLAIAKDFEQAENELDEYCDK